MQKLTRKIALPLAFVPILAACNGGAGRDADVQNKQLSHVQKTVASNYSDAVQELYIAYFGRPADPGGLANFEAALAADNAPTDIANLSLAYKSDAAVRTLIDSFGSSAESLALYGSGSTADFVTAIFQNVLGRAPNPSGLSFWAGAIDSGSLSRGDAALSIAAGALSNTTAQGLLDAELIANRRKVADYFTASLATQNATAGYKGSAAAAAARTMLNMVIAQTSTAAYQPKAVAIVTDLQSGASVATANASSVPSAPGQSQLVFSGYTFNVRSGGGGPGPNNWSKQNAWVDASGYLHLKISYDNGQWNAAEIYTSQSFGFGTYQFKIIGHPEIMDRNVVLGLFPYTTPAVGPDGTNEIDIEFATWGGVQPQHGNWTVWPANTSGVDTSYQFDMSGNTGRSTHRFAWSSTQLQFQALAGLTDTDVGQYANWTFAPANDLNLIPQNAIPLHMNLWLFQGQPPADGAQVELVISEFKFTAG
ncbi:MAG TPA: DUF4214 domain-containing protein [Burkholderiaceae bacterium]|jgi:hypothetical protein